jgi:hypothetical protein
MATRYMNAESAFVLPPAHLHIHLTISMSLLSPLYSAMMQNVYAHQKVARLAYGRLILVIFRLCSH